MRRLSIKNIALTIWTTLTESNQVPTSLRMDLLPTGLKRGKIRVVGRLTVKRDEHGKGTLVAIILDSEEKEAIKKLAKTTEDVDLVDILDNLSALEHAIQCIVEKQDRTGHPGTFYFSPPNLLG